MKPGVNIETDLRQWLSVRKSKRKKRTVGDLANFLGMPIRTVESWLFGRPCNTLTAERLVIPLLRRDATNRQENRK